MKLSLLGAPEADPGFYQAKTVLQTFSRILSKTGELLKLWKIFWLNRNGRRHPGPFAKLEQVFSWLDWHLIDPPFFTDHFGTQHSLQTMDLELLFLLLWDGWCQHIARQVRHKTMAGLDGMNAFLTKFDHDKAPMLQRMRISAIQSGAFIAAAEHGHYDDKKSRMCELCSVVDDRRHWLCCPRFRCFRTLCDIRQDEFAEEPECLVNHLLVPQLQAEIRYRRFLAAMDDSLDRFESTLHVDGVQHLFTDGACHKQHTAILTASWAVIHAGTGAVIGAAPLAGLRQTIDRAETTALLCALNWGLQADQDVMVWSDSKATITRAIFYQQNLDADVPDANRDLWIQYIHIMRSREHRTTEFRWIPGHLDPELTENPYEDWIAHWNSRADQIANQVLFNLNELHLGLRYQLSLEYDRIADKIRKLVKFFGCVAEHGQQLATNQTLAVESEEEEMLDPLCEQISPDWHTSLRTATEEGLTDFHIRLCGKLIEWDEQPGVRRWRSDIEVVFALAVESFDFPCRCKDGQIVSKALAMHFERPTLARLVKLVSVGISESFEVFDVGGLRCVCLAVDSLRIHLKGKGIWLSFPAELDNLVKQKIIGFTSSWPVRFARDLARPI